VEMSDIYHIDWYPHKAHADYARMDTEEIAVMSQIINLMYIHEGPIENDPKWLSGSIKDMGPAKCRNVIQKLIKNGHLFLDKNGYLVKKKCEKELKTTKKRMKKRENSEDFEEVLEPSIEQKQEVKNSPLLSTNTNTITKKEKHTKKKIDLRPPDVAEKTWADFVTLRKEKKAAITQTALSRIRKQAEIANITMEDALQECCARGWAGFKAEWMERNRNGNNRKPTVAEVAARVNAELGVS